MRGLRAGDAGGALVDDVPQTRIVRLTIASANVFVVEQAGRRLMIDAGNPGDEDESEQAMREQGIDPAKVE